MLGIHRPAREYQSAGRCRRWRRVVHGQLSRRGFTGILRVNKKIIRRVGKSSRRRGRNIYLNRAGTVGSDRAIAETQRGRVGSRREGWRTARGGSRVWRIGNLHIGRQVVHQVVTTDCDGIIVLDGDRQSRNAINIGGTGCETLGDGGGGRINNGGIARGDLIIRVVVITTTGKVIDESVECFRVTERRTWQRKNFNLIGHCDIAAGFAGTPATAVIRIIRIINP